MTTRITVPFLDANMLDVTVTAWRKAPGDCVQTGEIVAELTTDKATFELESTGRGTLLEILAAQKSVVPSGYILALLGEPGETDLDAAAYNDKLMKKYRSEIRGQRSEVSNQQKNVGALPRSAISDQNSEFNQEPRTKNQEPGNPPSTLRTRRAGGAGARHPPRPPSGAGTRPRPRPRAN
jgi:pyruvate dehydrogenase E2 component (dihydrolipoamide acetyltransferase)